MQTLLPKNINLVLCPICAGKGLKSIFGELNAQKTVITTKRGSEYWSQSGEKIIILCGQCKTKYIFLYGKGIFLTEPLRIPTEVTDFYAIHLGTI